MRSLTCDPYRAVGAVTRANISDAAGHRLVAKGRRLDVHDAARLVAAGITVVDVVVLDPTDIDENQAAATLAHTASGPGTTVAPAHHGRADITATCTGLLRVDLGALLAANRDPDLTLATQHDGSVVRTGARVASAKILPFAVAAHQLPADVAPVVQVLPFVRTRVGVLVVGAPATHSRLAGAHLPALTERLARCDAAITAHATCVAEGPAVAAALAQLCRSVDLVITVSETSVKGLDEPLPAGIVAAGGSIIRHGAPVEPGNLMLLARFGTTPVFAAPGCVRQRSRNLIDLLLPRLVADVVPSSADIAQWAHGGLLGESDD